MGEPERSMEKGWEVRELNLSWSDFGHPAHSRPSRSARVQAAADATQGQPAPATAFRYDPGQKLLLLRNGRMMDATVVAPPPAVAAGHAHLFYAGNYDGSSCNALGVGRTLEGVKWKGATNFNKAGQCTWTINGKPFRTAWVAGWGLGLGPYHWQPGSCESQTI